ncbi:hypothetical protein V6M85_12645 [Sulfolobus tengchongensis]|uniref:Uncharacterized protein n=1 Tax=Sulfolobus tengchongensis TaxID=207809 RepID=A0AAX4KZE8_9CREN
MDNSIILAYRKAMELNGNNNVHLFKDSNDSYYLIIVRSASCKDKSKIIDLIYDEVYKNIEHTDLMILIMSEETYSRFANENGDLEEVIL